MVLGICGGLSFLYGCGGGKSKKRFNRSISLLTWPVSGHLILTSPPHLKSAAGRDLTTMWKRSLIALLVPVLFLLTSPAAKAQCYGCTSGNIAKVVGGVAGGVAVIVVVVYYSTHHGRTLRGCAVSSPGGMELMNEGDQQTYALTGETAVIKAGDRVRVSGKKTKGDPNHRQFVVKKLSKDYGACKVTLAASNGH
jgi:hypothetical protein